MCYVHEEVVEVTTPNVTTGVGWPLCFEPEVPPLSSPLLPWDKIGDAEAELEAEECLEISEESSNHLSWLLRRAFIKKLPTVLKSKPNCCEIVICISFEGLLVSLKIACNVRLWRSVNTSRGFLGAEGCLVVCCCSSFRLQARQIKWCKNQVKSNKLKTWNRKENKLL